MQLEGYRAATGAAAWFDRSERGKIAVAGRDRRAYLHAMLTNDIATLQPVSGCQAAYLTPDGRMIADMRVLELGGLVLLDLVPGAVPQVMQQLGRFVFDEDVKLGDVTAAFAELSLVGPDAPSVLAAALAGTPGAQPAADDLRAWAEFRNLRASFQGEMVLLVSSRELGLPGFDLCVERPHAGDLAAALEAAGAVSGSAEAAEALRIEAGRPLFGRDMDVNTIPFEAGIEDRVLNYTKGCYPGQEVMTRIRLRAHGRVARRLAGLVVEGSTVPRGGDALVADGREAGRVTSAVRSPAVGAPIALAMLRHEFLDPGTELTVVRGAEMLVARVVPLPFQAPPGARDGSRQEPA